MTSTATPRGRRRSLPPAAAVLALLTLSGWCTTARADLSLCNRMSYVVDAALALESRGALATRGWFRLDPGRCSVVLRGPLDAEHVYVHARALALYGTAPIPTDGNDDLCVADKDFIIPGARRCKTGQHAVRFVEVRPAETETGLAVRLDEDQKDNYDADQARLAGIQRLLVVAGYDATPIDGVSGPKTEAALARFLKDHGLPETAATADTFFATLVKAAQRPASRGLSWCNDTPYPVMAAVGYADGDGLVTRGWYRLAPGTCLRPDVSGTPRTLYSFAEAVGDDGSGLRKDGKPVAWGGDTLLCTRATRFELTDQKDCAARGLDATGFAAVTLDGDGTVIRFKD